ncbi:hypothetical protein HYPSUDRAFT_71283 [Hypholoma sublateritium FD-334 SS-4]|uniref:DUF6533 domain-containing protein n=1 Tax=Hypholoma sublateritium (strain FD-334 SS-4) TaxID=945553 RepID=A0A0D2NJ72_HYPSF|nr:hypothetical protein HYPSUDRAFT_71283 [Hypholoma sublateritium FD-334 SS-4]
MGFWIVSSTLLIFDYLCTLSTEVDYVWKSSRARSIGILLFYLNRYLPFLDIVLVLPIRFFDISYKSIALLIPISVWSGVIGMLISQVIIYLRTFAIWNRDRYVCIILATLLVVVLSSSLVTLVLQTTQGLVNQLSGYANVSLKMLVLYSSIFAGEIVVVTLTMIKACQQGSHSSTVWVGQLYKNGIAFCLCMLTCSSVNILLLLSAPDPLKLMFMSFQRNLHSILCNRVIFLILSNTQPQSIEHAGLESRNSASRGGEQDFTMAVFTTVMDDALSTNSHRSADDASWAQKEWIK